jgi:hypothetical protein
MKNIKLLITGLFILFFNLCLVAQNPPNPPGEHGSDENQSPGGNASLAAGTLILIGLGALYGGKKIYDLRKNHQDE